MTDVQHLHNAPIKEALIDIRVTSAVDLDSLKQVHKLIIDRYPEKKDIQVKTIGFDFSKNKEMAASHDLEIIGYRYETEDGRNILQLKVDGFTFSRLEPYEDWESMVNEAKELWEKYTDIMHPKSITRIAVRYINAIALPLPIADFSDYITAAPIVPPELPQSLSGFLTRITINNPDTKSYCVVTQALEEGNDRNVSFVLDIDAVITDENRVNEYAPPYSRLWDDFEKLRDFKNKVFFNSITETTKRMLQ